MQSITQQPFLRSITSYITQSSARLPQASQEAMRKAHQLFSYCSRSRVFNQALGGISGVALAGYGVRYISQTFAAEPEEQVMSLLSKRLSRLEDAFKPIILLRDKILKLDVELLKVQTEEQKGGEEIKDGFNAIIEKMYSCSALGSSRDTDDTDRWSEGLHGIGQEISAKFKGRAKLLEDNKTLLIQEFETELGAFKVALAQEKKTTIPSLRNFEKKHISKTTGQFESTVAGKLPSAFLETLYTDIDNAFFHSPSSVINFVRGGHAPEQSSWEPITKVVDDAKEYLTNAKTTTKATVDARIQEEGYRRTAVKVMHLMIGFAMLFAGIGLAVCVLNPSLFGRTFFIKFCLCLFGP